MRVAILLALICACGKAASSSTSTSETATPATTATTATSATAAATAASTAPAPTVVTVPEAGPTSEVKVALARTDREHQRGLMYVQNLPPDDGMLFIFDKDDERNFWMKNTLIPLDMIFIRSDLTVVGVVANAKPLTTNPQTVGKDARFVLEVNGGWASHHGVTAGTKVRFENFSL